MSIKNKQPCKLRYIIVRCANRSATTPLLNLRSIEVTGGMLNASVLLKCILDIYTFPQYIPAREHDPTTLSCHCVFVMLHVWSLGVSSYECYAGETFTGCQLLWEPKCGVQSIYRPGIWTVNADNATKNSLYVRDKEWTLRYNARWWFYERFTRVYIMEIN